MILEEEVLMGIGKNVAYFEDLGYEIPRRFDKKGKLGIAKGTKITVKVKHIPLGSGVRLTKVCDECGKHIPDQPYGEITNLRKIGDGKDRCYTCGNKRRISIQKEKSNNERIGSVNKNKFGSLMEIVEYNKSDDIWVKFESGNLVHTYWDSFIKGQVANPYDRSVYGVGYMGEGNYKAGINYKQTPQFKAWHGMMKRCYKDSYQEKNPTYKGTSVCEEWHNYQNFAKWYDDNYYEIEGERTELDKDILIKENKIYSPYTCIFVPQRINYLFIKRKLQRGNSPIGTYYNKEIRKYTANCCDINGKSLNLGSRSDPKEAFQLYKVYKEQIIKTVAEEYKTKIPRKLYNIMITYEVEITD